MAWSVAPGTGRAACWSAATRGGADRVVHRLGLVRGVAWAGVEVGGGLEVLEELVGVGLELLLGGAAQPVDQLARQLLVHRDAQPQVLGGGLLGLGLQAVAFAGDAL